MSEDGTFKGGFVRVERFRYGSCCGGRAEGSATADRRASFACLDPLSATCHHRTQQSNSLCSYILQVFLPASVLFRLEQKTFIE